MRRLLQDLHYRQKSKRLTFSHFWYFPKNIFSLDSSSSQSESLPGLGVLSHGFWMIRSAGDYPISAGLLGHMISTISVIWSKAYVHAALNGFRMMDYAGRTVPPDYRRTCPWTSLTKSVLKLSFIFSFECLPDKYSCHTHFLTLKTSTTNTWLIDSRESFPCWEIVTHNHCGPGHFSPNES